jgi:prepilin-type N-terminal cleavage/methylation domain-containing protein
MRNRKGFTLVELLVVIGIIALLVSILMPALGRARELAKQIQCSSQQNGIGKAIKLYQNDFGDRSPRPWKQNSATWGFGGSGSGTGYNAMTNISKIRWANTNWSNWEVIQTVGGCLYLLVRYEDVDPKAFVCPSADNDIPMTLEDAMSLDNTITGWTELNDFPNDYSLSYSFNDPWFRDLDASDSGSLILMADKSPAYDYNDGQNPGNGFLPRPEAGGAPATGDNANVGLIDNNGNSLFNGTWNDDPLPGAATPNVQHGNSKNHATECQNVLFNDTHVKKVQTPCVGIREDNIYTMWFPRAGTEQGMLMIGMWAVAGNSADGDGALWSSSANISSASKDDSYLGN